MIIRWLSIRYFVYQWHHLCVSMRASSIATEFFLIQKIRYVLLALWWHAGLLHRRWQVQTLLMWFSKIFRKNSSVLFIFISVTTTSSTITLATTKEFQAISSPNYPSEVRYPTDTVFRITIQSPEGSFIQLIVLEFDWDRFCSYPLFIHNGKLYYTIYKPTRE